MSTRRVLLAWCVVASTLGSVLATRVSATVDLSVLAYGAIPNDAGDDTSAVQRANDAVAAQGGGRVTFPPGTYIVGGLQLDSHVELFGGRDAVLRHPNGYIPASVVRSRRTMANGSIDKGSSVLHLNTVARIEPGSPIAIRGAGGGSLAQATTLARSVSSTGGFFKLTNQSGFPMSTLTLLQVDNEIISYKGMNFLGLMNVVRGRHGTVPAAHSQGARISLLTYFYATVVSISGNDVILDRPATFTVKGTNVEVGTIGASVRGLSINGNRPLDKAYSSFSVPIDLMLARSAAVADTAISNGLYGAIKLDMGSTDSLVEGNVLMDSGRPDLHLGSVVWVFRGSYRNTVRNNTIGGNSYWGVAMDDRTQEPTEYDAPSDRNVVEGNSIDIPSAGYNMGVMISGSNDNIVRNNIVSSTLTGIAVERSYQGTTPLNSERNTVDGNTVGNHRTGIRVTGSYNAFASNVITESFIPVDDTGTGNVFTW